MSFLSSQEGDGRFTDLALGFLDIAKIIVEMTALQDGVEPLACKFHGHT